VVVIIRDLSLLKAFLNINFWLHNILIIGQSIPLW